MIRHVSMLLLTSFACGGGMALNSTRELTNTTQASSASGDEGSTEIAAGPEQSESPDDTSGEARNRMPRVFRIQDFVRRPVWVLGTPNYTATGESCHHSFISAPGAAQRVVTGCIQGFPEDATGMYQMQLNAPDSLDRPIVYTIESVVEHVHSTETTLAVPVVPGESIAGLTLALSREERASSAPQFVHGEDSIRANLRDLVRIQVGQGAYSAGQPVENLVRLLPGCSPAVERDNMITVTCEGVRAIYPAAGSDGDTSIEVFSAPGLR